MEIREVSPEMDTDALLTGAQFSDAYSVAIDDNTLNARRAAERLLGPGPGWITALLVLRNSLVKPFGLKTPDPTRAGAAGAIWIFPIVSETPARLVAGFNDRHLDFRVVVDVATSGGGQRVTATTLVLTHNLLGRTYLAIILPFHRLIIRSMMRQVAG